MDLLCLAATHGVSFKDLLKLTQHLHTLFVIYRKFYVLQTTYTDLKYPNVWLFVTASWGQRKTQKPKFNECLLALFNPTIETAFATRKRL